MNDTWILNDSEMKINRFISTLGEQPFRESVTIFFVYNIIRDQLKIGVIKYSIELEDYLDADISTATVKGEAILAAINLAQKLNLSLLIAHTHPPIRCFPKSWDVYDDGGFSKKDLIFMKSVNELINHKNNFELPIYYLVVDETQYSALAYYQNKCYYAKMPELEKKGFRQSDWRMDDRYE